MKFKEKVPCQLSSRDFCSWLWFLYSSNLQPAHISLIPIKEHMFSLYFPLIYCHDAK